ncbi:ribosome maturation protein Sdo1 [Streptacidiphilus sp. EB129]
MSTAHSKRALNVVAKIAGISIAALAIAVPVQSVNSGAHRAPVQQVRTVADSQWGDTQPVGGSQPVSGTQPSA